VNKSLDNFRFGVNSLTSVCPQQTNIFLHIILYTFNLLRCTCRNISLTVSIKVSNPFLGFANFLLLGCVRMRDEESIYVEVLVQGEGH